MKSLLSQSSSVQVPKCGTHALSSNVSGCCTGYALQPPKSSLRRTKRRHSVRPVVRGEKVVTRMGLKLVENFSADFELQPEAEQALHSLLSSEGFCSQVVQQCQLPDSTKVKFSGQLFQPVPWSVNTRRGMPAEFEKYADDPSFTVINIPPNFMFQAKIFKPSRLCAIYQHV